MPAFSFTEGEFEAQLKGFWKRELKDIESAAGIVIKSAADKHVVRQKADAKAGFRNTFHPASTSFAKAFKAYHLKPRGELGFASFSRAGPKHMGVYEEGAVITGTPLLGIRTIDGEHLKLPRIGHRSSRKLNYQQLLQFLFQRFGKKNVAPAKSKAGNPLLLVRILGKWLVVYTFLRSVKLPKVLNFFATADLIGREIPDQLKRLVNA